MGNDEEYLVCLQALNLQPRWELRHTVLARVEQDGRGEWQRRRGPAQFELERVLARGLDEDGREELGAGLHPEPLLCLLALAGKADDASGGVDEAADKETLRRGLAGRVLADLAVQFVGANHVAALAVHTIKSSFH